MDVVAQLPQPGDRIGDFEITGQLGTGGHAIVLSARQIKMKRDVAIKMLLPIVVQRNPRITQRFLREIDLVGRISHPNLVMLYDAGETEHGVPWMATELVRGTDLKTLLEEELFLEPERAICLGLQVLAGLSEAHEHMIVHRDITPHNIMLTGAGLERELVKIVDFGIGKALGGGVHEASDPVTSLGNDLPTSPHYSPPEVLRREESGPRGDVYSAGLVILEMLTGRRAVEGDTIYEVYARQVSNPIEGPEWLAYSPLGPVLARATLKDPARRYPSAVEFRAAVAEIDHEDVVRPPRWREYITRNAA